MPGQNAIDAMHRRIVECASEVVPDQPTIVPVGGYDRQRWGRQVQDGGRVSFEMIPADSQFEVRATREQGGRVSVFPLHNPAFLRAKATEDSPALWFSWFDSWYRRRAKEYHILSASWSIFFGVPRDNEKNQVLRAEWDNVESLPKTPSEHAQPHWHVDGALSVDPFVIEQDYMNELNCHDGIKIDGIHLGMGGWKISSHVAGVRRWQIALTDDHKQIGDWACEIFEYIREQMKPDHTFVTPVSLQQ